MTDRAHKPTGRRMSAGELCRNQGWEPGTLLASSRWKKPRQLLYIGPREVELTHGTNRMYVKTLPSDVTEANG